MTPAESVRLVLATRNLHKLSELERMLGGDPGLDPLPDEVVLGAGIEVGATFAENALIKARVAVAATGRAAVADDSGIEADALGGAPGVRSARYAGPDATDAENLAKLRAQAPPGSGLRYVCVIAHVTPGGAENTFAGVCVGAMAPEERGTGGFGYDPVFLTAEDPAGLGRTMAQLMPAEKDAISHRGRAAEALRTWLASR